MKASPALWKHNAARLPSLAPSTWLRFALASCSPPPLDVFHVFFLILRECRILLAIPIVWFSPGLSESTRWACDQRWVARLTLQNTQRPTARAVSAQESYSLRIPLLTVLFRCITHNYRHQIVNNQIIVGHQIINTATLPKVRWSTPTCY